MTGWPRQGRCGACHRPAEQFPSMRWLHLDGRSCPGTGAAFPFTVPAPPKVFVPDCEPLPEPPAHGCWVPNYEGDDPYPKSMGWYSQRQMAGWWEAWRDHVNAEVSA